MKVKSIEARRAKALRTVIPCMRPHLRRAMVWFDRKQFERQTSTETNDILAVGLRRRMKYIDLLKACYKKFEDEFLHSAAPAIDMQGVLKQILKENNCEESSSCPDTRNFEQYAVEITGVTGAGKSTFTKFLISQYPGLKLVKPGKLGNWVCKDEPYASSVVTQLNLLMASENVKGNILERGTPNNFLWKIILIVWSLLADGTITESEILEKVITLFSYILPSLLFAWSKEPKILMIPKDEEDCQERMKSRAKGSDVWRAKLPGYITIQQIVYGLYGTVCGGYIIDSILFSPENILNKLPSEFKKHFEQFKESPTQGEIVKKEEEEKIEAPKPLTQLPKEIVHPLPYESTYVHSESIASSVGLFKSVESCLARTPTILPL